MPKSLRQNPLKLEDQCVKTYLNYLYDEINLISKIRAYETKSVLLKKFGLQSEALFEVLQTQLSTKLRGILHDLVRQKMLDIVISRLHIWLEEVKRETEMARFSSLAYNASPAVGALGGPSSTTASSQNSYSDMFFGSSSTSYGNGVHLHPIHGGASSSSVSSSAGPSSITSTSSTATALTSPFAYASQMSAVFERVHSTAFPFIQLLQLILHRDTKVIDFSQNKYWPDLDVLQDLSKIIWRVIGDKCANVSKFIVPKELTYCSTMNQIFTNCGQNLRILTLKRNVPNNVFLQTIGVNCPNLKELDIAGADVVTDFGVVCLLFADPEQIFIECWNKEKTVGSMRRSVRAFPHPHFDKPIPDPTEGPSATRSSSTTSNQYLHLKKNFHDVIKERDWEVLPIATSLEKLRLENTKVKGDGASVVLETCPNLYSLGYLVFAAAGMKQVFGFELTHDTKFTEIFYRGPSDQKLQTIANCCSKLRTMFLGSNNIRRMNVSVFSRWTKLEYLTLENINREDVFQCLNLIGKQLLGLKIQCVQFDIIEIAVHCPRLKSLILQKEAPVACMNMSKLVRVGGPDKVFQHLEYLEINCPNLPKQCFNFFIRTAKRLKSAKIFQVQGLTKEDIESWAEGCQYLDTLLIFKAPEIDREMVEMIMDFCPSLRVLGDFSSFDIKRPTELKRLQSRIKEENWDLRLTDTDVTLITLEGSEKEFNKKLTLHWFYLTEAPMTNNADSPLSEMTKMG